jgi:hypothetical protein
VGTRKFKPTGFTVPQVLSTCYSVLGAHYHTPKWNPGFKLCYSVGARRLCSPQNMEAQHSPLSLAAKDPWFLYQTARMLDSPLQGRTQKRATLQVPPEALFSPMYTEAQHFTLHLPTGEPSPSSTRAGIWASPLSGMHYTAGARRPAPPIAETQYSPWWLQESHHACKKEWELQPPHWGEKKSNLQHKKNTARGNISSITLSDEYC